MTKVRVEDIKQIPTPEVSLPLFKLMELWTKHIDADKSEEDFSVIKINDQEYKAYPIAISLEKQTITFKLKLPE